MVVILIPLNFGTTMFRGSLNTPTYALLRTIMHQLYDGLHDVILKFLKTIKVQENVL